MAYVCAPHRTNLCCATRGPHLSPSRVLIRKLQLLEKGATFSDTQLAFSSLRGLYFSSCRFFLHHGRWQGFSLSPRT